MAPEPSESGHALLGPSAAARWISCPASVRQSEAVPPEEDSKFAREGTAAHALAEMYLRAYLSPVSTVQFDRMRRAWFDEYGDVIEDEQDMIAHVHTYVDFVLETLAQTKNSVLFVEQRVQTGIPGCWGTADAVIVSPDIVHVIDLKYGQGIIVGIDGNPQLRLYGVGALEELDLIGAVKTVRMSIVQPRTPDPIRTSEITADELRHWRNSLKPIAEMALSGVNAYYGPSEKACQWCPVRGRCRAQLRRFAESDFGPPATVNLLSPEEVGRALSKVKAHKHWLESLEEAALRMAFRERTPIPGWKVVNSGGRRVVADPNAFYEHALNLGFDPEVLGDWSMYGIGKLEKALGKNFELFSEFIETTPGKPSLVPESDKRPEVDPIQGARSDFA